MALTFDQIIEKYRENSTSERDKGDKFERLMQAYLLTKPTYKSLLTDVWLWSDFPYKDQFGTGGKDTGIDLVCRTHDGEYWAVQCKFYRPEAKIDLHLVSTFLLTASYPFNTKDGKKNFSHRIWIDTTYDGFNSEALNAINKVGCTRLGLIDLKNDDVDWEALDSGKKGTEAVAKKYDLRPHQKDAFDATTKYFIDHERGKLIMACGTGKTFTSLRIAEALATDSHLVLFLVPSIALLSQTLKEWSAQCKDNIYPICICSDSHATDKAEDSISDLVLPATTDANKVYNQFVDFRARQASEGGMIVVFSTYQSIDVIGDVQKQINSLDKDSFIFDLIVCDEAHRTTGVKQKDKLQSAFTKVHSNDNVKAKKRLYMTATPRLYSSEAQSKAKEKEVEVWSMDDPEMFGEEIYRIGFGAAVEKQLLSDYKVIVLTLDENSVEPQLLNELLEGNADLKESDAIKLIGCINVLSKRTNYLTDKELFSDVDPEPMKSAVAFCSSIKNSIYLKDSFNVCQQAYYEKMSEEERDQLVVVQADHVDGGMGSTVREEKLEWLKKADSGKKECRVLNNVRCLSEGVDVPSLDAIMFLSSRNSQVDVVQSVGRVMRRAEGKKFGYIIIPVLVPADKNADEVLDDSDDFKIVWSVLNALRAHDDRFNATINKIELNKKKPKIISVTGGGNFGGKPVVGEDTDDYGVEPVQGVLDFDELQQELYDKFQKLTGQVFAKMVNKCGSRRYWADWGKDVGEIAKRNIDRINKLIAVDGDHKDKFNAYWEGLKKNLNPSVSQAEAVEMLAQHMITKPVFEALFGNDHFTKENPVSKSLEEIVTLLDEKSDPEDMEKLERFYDDVRKRAEGIDNAEAKQKVVLELYNSFFNNAFPQTVKKLGIVYTPVEVVDFILYSTEYVLNKEFGRSISDEKVNVIDPFTGTGTFITRLLQSGIIKKEDIERKYKHEIFANEIVLLAYYIASVNIENAYHDLNEKDTYEPFNGICLTDTFQLYENPDPSLDDKVFGENSERVNEQKKTPITVIVGNPPYSEGQDSENDNAKNQKYELLDDKIRDTYAKHSQRKLKKGVYNSYIRAFRWATDRLENVEDGVIAFITNGGWVRNSNTDGLRKCFADEFSKVHVINLRGDIKGRTGEDAKREGQNVFDIVNGVAITILIKSHARKEPSIFYASLDDYLSRKDKLNYLAKTKSIEFMSSDFKKIQPNKQNDWISERNSKFETFIGLGDKDTNTDTFFTLYSGGLLTSRDTWCYNYSKTTLIKNVTSTIDFYNSQLSKFPDVSYDTTKISWSRALLSKAKHGKKLEFKEKNVREAYYRPFMKEYVYFDEDLNEVLYQNKAIFPSSDKDNLIITVSGNGGVKGFSVLMCNSIRDFGTYGGCQCYPLHWYQKIAQEQGSLFDNDEFVRHEGISDFILSRAQSKYGNKVTREDIFYYVYGLLHSKSYAENFAEDLSKSLPKIPLVSDFKKFWLFSETGKKLSTLHVNYDTQSSYDGVVVVGREKNDYSLTQMSFEKNDRSIIHYNEYITISNIPDKAYNYIVNGQSAIEHVMEWYGMKKWNSQAKKSGSGIINNPNDWLLEHKSDYVLNLLLSVINISVQSVDLIESLPEVDWDKE